MPWGCPSSVAALASTNDIVVQGSPDKLALAEQLIKTFDSPEATARIVIEIVMLENAQAISLAEVGQESNLSAPLKGNSRFDPSGVVGVPAIGGQNELSWLTGVQIGYRSIHKQFPRHRGRRRWSRACRRSRSRWQTPLPPGTEWWRNQ